MYNDNYIGDNDIYMTTNRRPRLLERNYSTPYFNINCVVTPLKYRGRDETPDL